MHRKKIVLGILVCALLIGGFLCYYPDRERSPLRQVLGTDSYDVIVVSGEPEGVAAAVAAARNGAQTLLIEPRDGLGGLFTYGMLTGLDMANDMYNRPANQGIFREWHRMVGGLPCFDVGPARHAFTKLVMQEPNLDLALNTRVKRVELSQDGRTIKSITVQGPRGERTYRAARFVDSTPDADLAVAAGVPYFTGKEDIGVQGKPMCVTLIIHLKNVDWEEVKKAGASGKLGGAQFYYNALWGFKHIATLYKPHSPNTRLRGLNISRQGDGTVTINALQIFGVDGLSKESLEKGLATGKEETGYVVKFLRANLPGFERAEIASYPSELYIRETRHIRAEYQLPVSDIWENRDHWDSIGLGAYPVDLQATTPQGDDSGLINPIQYAIPFRCLVPLKVDNLLVASRSSGYSSLAAGSARTVPTGMTVGEAAGTAAAISIRTGQDFRTMSKDKKVIALLQNTLKAQGANLYHFKLGYPYQGEWFYPYIKTLYSKGLLFAGYDNNIHPNDPFSEHSLVNLLRAGLDRTDRALAETIEWPARVCDEPVSRDHAAALVLRLLEKSTVEESKAWELLHQQGLIPDLLFERVSVNRELKRVEGQVMVAHLMQKYGKNNRLDVPSPAPAAPANGASVRSEQVSGANHNLRDLPQGQAPSRSGRLSSQRVAYWKKPAGRRILTIPILMYHEIGSGPNSLYVSESDFKRHVYYLYQHGYRGITLAQSRKIAAGKPATPAPGKPVVLTFDDGYLSFYTKAWPVLRQFGFKATAFVITSQVGRPRHMSWEQLRELAANGIEIGSHTETHPNLVSLKGARLASEIAGSRYILKKELGLPVQSFCYPCGRFNWKTVDEVKKAGYLAAVTTRSGFSSSKSNRYYLPRIRAGSGLHFCNSL